METSQLFPTILGVCAAMSLTFLAAGCLWFSRRSSQQIPQERRSLLPTSVITSRSTTVLTKDNPEPKPKPSVPKKKPSAHQEEVLMLARMFLRGSNYEKPKLLNIIGSRKNKHFVQVEEKNGDKKIMMTMTNPGQECEWFSSDKSKASFTKLLSSLQNPFIYPCLGSEYFKEKNTLVAFRSFQAKGSLRDYIHNAKPTKPHQIKYTQTTGNALSDDRIAKYGRQILEGLDYLQIHSIPFYHLHTGNVIIDNGICRLSEVENDLMCIPPKLKSLIQGTKSPASPAVIAFGCVLYEMAVGYELDRAILDDLPSTCNPKVRKILRSIFLSTKKSEGEDAAPTVQSLIQNPFFASVKLYSDWQPQQVKLGSRMKKLLQDSTSKTEKLFTAQKKSATKKNKSQASDPSTTGNTNVAPASPQNVPVPAPPGLIPPPPPGPPPPPSAATHERKNLLSSIEGFNPSKLKKAETNDRSGPSL